MRFKFPRQAAKLISEFTISLEPISSEMTTLLLNNFHLWDRAFLERSLIIVGTPLKGTAVLRRAFLIDLYEKFWGKALQPNIVNNLSENGHYWNSPFANVILGRISFGARLFLDRGLFWNGLIGNCHFANGHSGERA